MSRYTRNTTILAKIEGSYAVDSVPTGAANAILVSEAEIVHNYNNVDRNLIRPFMGASEQLVGTKHNSLNFSVELQGGGTAGTAPALDPLLRMAGFAESALLTPSRVEYDLVSSDFESASIYDYADGVLHKSLGCRANVELSALVGEIPRLRFSALAIDGGVTAEAPSGVTYASWKTPLVITEANVATFNLGCTYSAGVFSGGAEVCSRGLSLNLNNETAHIPTLGCEGVDLTNRNASGTLTLDLSAAEEVAAYTAVEANTLTSIGMTIGSTAGYKVMIFCPYVQRTNPKYEDVSGRLHVTFDLRIVPGPTGNNEVKIIFA